MDTFLRIFIISHRELISRHMDTKEVPIAIVETLEAVVPADFQGMIFDFPVLPLEALEPTPVALRPVIIAIVSRDIFVLITERLSH